jgi:hypothetical protein
MLKMHIMHTFASACCIALVSLIVPGVSCWLSVSLRVPLWVSDYTRLSWVPMGRLNDGRFRPTYGSRYTRARRLPTASSKPFSTSAAKSMRIVSGDTSKQMRMSWFVTCPWVFANLSAKC